MNTCKDCKWWELFENSSIGHYGKCKNFDVQKQISGAGANVFLPDSDFGCNQWEEKLSRL